MDQQEKPKRRMYGRPFPKGQSGNPGGRPAVIHDIARLAQTYTLDAMNTLQEICRNPKATPAARVSAAEALLDRGYGKATATLNVTHTNAQEMTRDELLGIAASRGAGTLAKDGRAGEPAQLH